MNENCDLLVCKNKGRPSAEERFIMSCETKLKEAILEMKREMGFNDDTEVIIACSISSDEMLRHVHMFPEVFFVDVTANTNRQKLGLFIQVVRDTNRESHVGNVTFIPSGQAWVFLKIYKVFFENLFGKATISRNRLCLTDEDKSEFGPLERMMATEDHWKKSMHMLCVFHALVKPFHEKICPILPHKMSQSKRSLTNLGKACGECMQLSQQVSFFQPTFVTVSTNAHLLGSANDTFCFQSAND